MAINADQKTLARAARVRARRLARKTEVYGACACAWPVKVLRNGHGHDDACPAVAIVKRHREEDELAHE